MKEKKLTINLVLVLLFAALISGCNLVPALVGLVPVADAAAESDLPPVFGPEAARDAALDFIRLEHPEAAPRSALLWQGTQQPEENIVGSARFQYISGSWSGGVSFPLTSPLKRIYSVQFEDQDSGFTWEGVVDSAGRVITTLVTYQQLEVTSEPVETQPAEGQPTNPPQIDSLTFRDKSFNLKLEYPEDWSLEEHIIGDEAKALSLRKGTLYLAIYYKYSWDKTGFGGGLPLGDVVDRGRVSLLGRLIPRHFVVYEGKEKAMFYGDRFEDLEFYIYLETDLGSSGTYYDIDLSDALFDEVDRITSSIVRTAPPVKPPTATPKPTLVPTPTPTAVTRCDWVEFVKDVTIPDGSEITAGKTFVKTWRLRNRGTCSWTTGYSLVFESGDPMSEKLEIPLPELVAPGNAINLSLTMTAPDSPGHYRGYWMLRNTSGRRFGAGSNADKAFYVDIYAVGEVSSKGMVSGKICYPSERIPPMTLYLLNIDRGNLTSVPIKADQGSYQVEVDPGTYIAYAWTIGFEQAGSYGSVNHPLESFMVEAGKTTVGIDICDWYHAPGEIPFPDPSKYGTIKGSLSFPGETIPALRIIAFNAYDHNAYFWVDTLENQDRFEINQLLPGEYVVVAYVKSGHLSGGYTGLVKCGFEPACPRDHDLVVIHVDPGSVIEGINPADWFALPGTFPQNPTR